LNVEHELLNQGAILLLFCFGQIVFLHRIPVKMIQLIGLEGSVLDELPRTFSESVVIASLIAEISLSTNPDECSIESRLRLL
jgi:hypothetical protein